MTDPGQLRPMVFVGLGQGAPENDALWRKSPFIREVVRYAGAAPSGRRAGSRALGLGLDSAIVALKVLSRGHRGPYLAANPWVAAALKMVGKREVFVTGIYAQVGSRSFRILRRILGASKVVTTVAVEAEAWNASGGNATEVLYGNTFRYPRYRAAQSEGLRIFIGGSSDRDPDAIDRLESEIQSSTLPISLVIASDGPPSSQRSGSVSVTRTGRVTATRFGELVSQSDVVFLPLKDSRRAAGHMVTVGALEAGVSVVASPSAGMDGYFDGEFVSSLVVGAAVLPQLIRAAENTRQRSHEIALHWESNFSLPAYIERVGNALAQLESRQWSASPKNKGAA